MSEGSGCGHFLFKARFPFQQTNEDELSFSKGDIINVSRQEEGGWWEGSLNGKTGWFPSNYVRELKGSGGCSNVNTLLLSHMQMSKAVNAQTYTFSSKMGAVESCVSFYVCIFYFLGGEVGGAVRKGRKLDRQTKAGSSTDAKWRGTS